MQHTPPSASNLNKMARYYAKIAVRALYDEIALYPKPGLVSFVDTGAHQDMDGALFFRSLFGLRHYFIHVGQQAALNAPPAELVKLGLQAEQTMQKITSGVNTHRGAIFALGIMCSSICKLSLRYKKFYPQDLHLTIKKEWAYYLQKHHQNINTHGSLVKQKYAVADAKQMAIDGYKLVFDTYLALAEIQHDKEFFGLLAYQQLLLAMDDINILYRTGPEGLQFARYHIQQAISLDNRARSIQEAARLHLLFSQCNISPGGVADMLGLIYFLRHVFGEPS
ncbi:triphosphoribosyl-dephospho-CoA synthase MdcB [Legionella saoudiensis]|uniref:triphosphoribosyl-dephospho-CoA synthase MdcB n=1 Tax=Legionella saoudiensis TaxID=1750561 RepID=UPI000730810D|nr:triphosphoribosyl-dephospho-CoA synthase MdcB [Legionella saoudiensis]